jgi:hypothetical protein
MAVGLLEPTLTRWPAGDAPAGAPAPEPVGPAPDGRVAGARAMLERARALVEQGWVQDAFYVVRGRRGEPRPVSPFGLLLLTRSDVVGACLVGAVAHASSAVARRERRGQAALAVDTLWSALTGEPVVDAHPTARPARVRDLARWNDEPGRRREDVVALLDRALSGAALR